MPPLLRQRHEPSVVTHDKTGDKYLNYNRKVIWPWPCKAIGNEHEEGGTQASKHTRLLAAEK